MSHHGILARNLICKRQTLTGGAVKYDLSSHKQNNLLDQRKAKRASAEETRHRRVLMRQVVEDDPLLLKNHPDPGGGKVDLVACTATKKAETIGFAFAENELE
jgi:hypothetical protein